MLKKKLYCNDHTITEFGIIDSKNCPTAYVILYELIDTWFLDSNRRVGVWSLPWHWHIISIPLTIGRGTGAETCGLDDVFPPDDLCSRLEALLIYIYTHFLYEFCYRTYIHTTGVSFSFDEAAPHHILYDCISGECAVPGMNATVWFLWFTNCVLLSDDNSLIPGCLWLLVFVLKHIDTRYLVFDNPSPHRMFLSLDLLSEYRIQHGAIGHLYVTSSYSTWIFCRGVSGFATDCPCDFGCRGFTTCLLHVGPPFGNRFLNNSWAVGLT